MQRVVIQLANQSNIAVELIDTEDSEPNSFVLTQSGLPITNHIAVPLSGMAELIRKLQAALASQESEPGSSEFEQLTLFPDDVGR